MNPYKIIKTYDDKSSYVLTTAQSLAAAKEWMRSEWLWLLSEAKDILNAGSFSDTQDCIRHDNYTITIQQA